MDSQEDSISIVSPERLTTPKKECVQVVVRCRPMNQKEVEQGYNNVVEVYPDSSSVEIINPKDDNMKTNKKAFTFDAVHDWKSTQQSIYDELVRPLVDSVLMGFNGTIFAYGQTGTGKTYTMEGCKDNLKAKGIIPNSFEHIFSHISKSPNTQFLVRSSYLEIYQEEIRDLLVKNPEKKLELRENPGCGIYVKGLKSQDCTSIEDIERVMSVGNLNRTVGATDMNERSSRSHAIFMIRIEMSDNSSSDKVRVGKLNLVDLAGSERQSKTGSSGGRLKEASKINLSLSALGNVISALVDGKGHHIPYRDSKLTRLLQDSLGGNSKTLMIANIGPASYNYEETVTTLRYASRAKNIQNKPRINEDPKDTLIREYQEEINRLKNMLADKMAKHSVGFKKTRKRKDDTISVTSLSFEDICKAEDDNINKEISNIMSTDATDSEKYVMMEEVEKKKKELEAERQVTEELAMKLKMMESKLIQGGKNIIDHTNHQKQLLERHTAEINKCKQREAEMRRMLREKEEYEQEIRGVYTNLVNECDIKRKKIKKYETKLEAIVQEINDCNDQYSKDRIELQTMEEALTKDLKKWHLVAENFVPQEEVKKVIETSFYDFNEQEWKSKEENTNKIDNVEEYLPRLTSCEPKIEFANKTLEFGSNARYPGHRILKLDLYKMKKTTKDYTHPSVSPALLSVLESVLQEDDLDLDASKFARGRVFDPNRNLIAKNEGRAGAQKYPKARGLVKK
ncbi:unnamed protein product [Bemisia tabaci]|uniref:Kinesin-like protein n=1 Tax=Bemisia tabaci TaxID=7038 RepID=A0A9P0F8X7_BEMTA|nr:PREDICTED: kinesin-II 95 kDa subunit [Bemisia tabaci]CAH0394745.1 unnamed protein product [Bemisia tabaci]